MRSIEEESESIKKEMRAERSETQLTLGALIAALEKMPADAQVANLRDPDSYLGYYEDLYFELHEGTRPASKLLACCNRVLGEVFIGYKGGEFVMDKQTPLWVAKYGQCGPRLMAVHVGGEIETSEQE